MSISWTLSNKSIIQPYCRIFSAIRREALHSSAFKIISLIFVLQKDPQSDYAYMFIYTPINSEQRYWKDICQAVSSVFLWEEIMIVEEEV